MGKDIDVAYAALLNSESGKIVVPGIQAERSAETTARKTVRQAADGYIEQSRVEVAVRGNVRGSDMSVPTFSGDSAALAFRV